MSIEAVKRFFSDQGMGDRVMEFEVSSATVELAAQAAGVEPGRIAKTLSFADKTGGCILVVTAGTARINNTKFKAEFSMKATMLSADEVLSMVGHAVGGVCPFAINENIPVYLDISLRRYETVFPACGSGNSAIELSCGEMYRLSGARKWIDVCKDDKPPA